MDILIATLVVGIIGLVLGVALVATGRKFHVETDPREAAVRELLPGNNCGACGYAGCDAVAGAIAKGEAPANACPVCSSDKAEQIAAVMGVTDCRAAALAGLDPWARTHGCLGYGSCAAACPKGLIELIPAGKKAAVRCSSPDKGVEVRKLCAAGCLGCGICVKQCPEEAVTLTGTLAHVDYEKCVACGKCGEKCPTHAVALTK